MDVLKNNGHPIDKVEFRVLGGTFAYYDYDVTDKFIRDLYYAANIYNQETTRPPLTINEEQEINTNSQVHVVGLGIETRPDEINECKYIKID